MTSAPLTVELDAVYLLIGLPMRKQWSESQKADEAQARRARHQAAIAAAEQLLQSLQQARYLVITPGLEPRRPRRRGRPQEDGRLLSRGFLPHAADAQARRQPAAARARRAHRTRRLLARAGQPLRGGHIYI
eukprot:scaffold69829_cov69-Phaeocystis_antarctica.AAC.5